MTSQETPDLAQSKRGENRHLLRGQELEKQQIQEKNAGAAGRLEGASRPVERGGIKKDERERGCRLAKDGETTTSVLYPEEGRGGQILPASGPLD